MPCWTQKLAAAVLVGLYGVLGASGAALYYCFESRSGQLPVKVEEQGGYCHEHGDGVWHYHNFGHVPDESEGNQADSSPRSADRREVAFRACTAGHHNHSCLLLTLASTVAQSVTATAATLCAQANDVLTCASSDCWILFSSRYALSARGPPLQQLA